MTNPPNLPTSRPWTTEDVATFLQVSTSTVKRLRTDGAGPSYRTIGRQVRYIPADVIHWFKSQPTTRKEKDA